MARDRILLGVVGRPHGVRGLVHVHSYTAGLAPMPAFREQPQQSAPKKKAQERAKAAAG